MVTLKILTVKNLFSLGLGVAILFSCTKEVQVAFPEHEPQLVINSLFSPDKAINVTLGESKAILDDSDRLPIKDAQIVLHQGNVQIDSLVWQEETRTYKSTIKALEGNVYGFQLNYKDNFLRAKDHIPRTPLFENSVIIDSVYFGGEGEFFNQLTITLIDNPDEENFYELVLLYYKKHSQEEAEEESQSFFNDFTSSVSYDVNNNDPIILSEGLLPYYPETLLFTDKNFSHTRQTLKLNYDLFNLSFYDNNTDREISVILKLRSVSSNYYTYKKNQIIHLNNQESDLWEGTGEPISVYSNISNGLGIFAGYNEVIDTIQKQLPQ